MSGVVHIYPAAITFPEDFDALLDTCTTVNAQNARTWAMDKVVVSGVRRVSAIDVEDFLSLCIQLKETGDAPNPPKFLTLAMETRGEGAQGPRWKRARSECFANPWSSTCGGVLTTAAYKSEGDSWFSPAPGMRRKEQRDSTFTRRPIV